MNLKLGSHNSFSYLKPKHWYMYPFWFVAKCQSLDILNQYKAGSRIFDVRVNFNKSNEFQVSHGLMVFDIDKEHLLDKLDMLNLLVKQSKDAIYVRIIYEENSSLLENPLTEDSKESYFKQFCKQCETSYNNLIFFGGCRKYDWKQLYDFKTTPPDMQELYSSVTGSKLDDWFPWLYAATHNKKNKENFIKENKHQYLFMDFVK